MAIESAQTMTVEEYFQLEANDPNTHYEYIDGHVYAMVGGTANHDTIKANMQKLLWHLLRGSPWRVYSSDMKVLISKTRYLHPDVIVTRDPHDRETAQAIQSPYLVVEVLSPNTEIIDRTWKLKNYRMHPTIEEYILIDSKSFKIEIYHRENNQWFYDVFGDDEVITLYSLMVHFSLTDVYRNIEFEDTTDTTLI